MTETPEARVWNETGFVADDPWKRAGEDAASNSGDHVLVPLAAFLENPAPGPHLGVLVAPGDDVSALAPHFERLSLVALAFPAFSDGRGFSHASLLRRLGFVGEIRAVGDVLIDQIPLMLRCGIDSFEVTNRIALKRLEEGRLPGISRHYQPAARKAGEEGGYSWRRASMRPA